MPVKVDRDKCSGCKDCIASCPFEAIELQDGKASINEYCQACMACLSVCPEGAIFETESEEPKPQKAEGYSGVWIFAEQRSGKVSSVAYELLGIGRRLADDLKTELSALLFGAEETDARELIRWGADKVYHAKDNILQNFNDEPYAQLLTKLINEHRPEIVLAGATPIGRSFLPRVAARIRTGLTADCTSLSIDKETGNLLQIRPAFGGNIMATIICPSRRPQMATVRPRVMKIAAPDQSRAGEVIRVDDAGPIEVRTRLVETVREVTDKVDLAGAEVIVTGGRGLGHAEGFDLLRRLAERLGGVVGASRGAVDNGWIDYAHQVGQTGRTVAPKLYIACGVSGAVQHLVGMQSSDVIVAINSDAQAPIFGVATYGIVGDLYQVVPAMLTELGAD